MTKQENCLQHLPLYKCKTSDSVTQIDCVDSGPYPQSVIAVLPDVGWRSGLVWSESCPGFLKIVLISGSLQLYSSVKVLCN